MCISKYTNVPSVENSAPSSVSVRFHHRKLAVFTNPPKRYLSLCTFPPLKNHHLFAQVCHSFTYISLSPHISFVLKNFLSLLRHFQAPHSHTHTHMIAFPFPVYFSTRPTLCQCVCECARASPTSIVQNGVSSANAEQHTHKESPHKSFRLLSRSQQATHTPLKPQFSCQFSIVEI